MSLPSKEAGRDGWRRWRRRRRRRRGVLWLFPTMVLWKDVVLTVLPSLTWADCRELFHTGLDVLLRVCVWTATAKQRGCSAGNG